MKRSILIAIAVASGLRCAAAAERAAPPTALVPSALPALPSAALPDARPEVWPMLEETLVAVADVPLKPGAQAAWIDQTREWLRSHPESTLPQALGKAFSQVYALSAAAQELVEASLSQPLAPVSLPGTEIKRLIKNGSEIYAIGPSGVYRREGERWMPLISRDRDDSWPRRADVSVHDGAVYVSEVCDRSLYKLYEIRGAKAVPIAEKMTPFAVLLHSGKLYMSGEDGLHVKEADGWRTMPGSQKLGGVDSLAEIDGTLYAGARGGIYRHNGSFWSQLRRNPFGALWRLAQGSVRWSKLAAALYGPMRLLAHEGVLYAAHSYHDGHAGVTKHGLAEIVNGKARRVLVDATDPIDLFAHAGYLYALSNHWGRPLLFERKPTGWQRTHDEASPFLERATIGSDLYFRTQDGTYLFGADGSRRRISPHRFGLAAGAENAGRRYFVTASGLAELAGEQIKVIWARSGINDVVGIGRDLLLATEKGVHRLILDAAGIPWDWQPGILETVAQGITSAAEAAAPERPLLRDRGGRALLGLQGQ